MDARTKFSEAASELNRERNAAMDPVKRAEHMAMMREARLAAIAEKRARGERVDHMSPETRKRVAQAGGKARATKRWAEATDEERKESVDKLPQARAVLAATRTWLRPPGNQGETLLVRDHVIALPMSAPRSKRHFSWCKLLADADPTLTGSYAFTGEPKKPGQVVSDQELRPSRDFPPIPVVLECAGPCGDGGQYRYILWQLQGRLWIEIGRSESRSWEWSKDLAPMALRVLSQYRDVPRKKERRIAVLIDRLELYSRIVSAEKDRDVRYCGWQWMNQRGEAGMLADGDQAHVRPGFSRSRGDAADRGSLEIEGRAGD